MSVYQYADFYDLFHKNKDYVAEIAYIDQLIKNHNVISTKTILDIGCGTGKHACALNAAGYKVFGIDRSPKMIEIASQNSDSNCAFLIADAHSYKFQQSFDLILSLSRVASYQASNEMFDAYLQNVVEHLNPGGLFMFDFWYGPAVLSTKPETRVKRIRTNRQNVVRIAEPELHYEENCTTIKYEVFVNELGECSAFSENHKMRYFFLPELQKFCDAAGLSIIKTLEWMHTDARPSVENPTALVITIKK